MTGGDSVPERPRREDLDDPECVQFVTGGYRRLQFCIFGVPFTGGGLLCLGTAVGVFRDSDSPSLGWGGVAALLMLGTAHAAVGCGALWFALCSSEWVRFDRRQGLLTRQIGFLGFRRFAKATLPEFSEVSILPATNKWQCRDDFEIALTGLDDKRFPIGRVTLSYDLAREFGQEVATFLDLPLH